MSFGSILSAVAPTIEAALPFTGPYGAIASMAVKAAASILTPNEPNPTPAKIMAALPNASPEQLLQLQQADNDLKLKLQQLNVDVLKIKADLEASESKDDTADRVSARQTFGILKFVPQLVLSTVFVAGYLVLVYELVDALLTGKVALAQVNPVVLSIVSSLVSVMTAAVLQILNFWFGSSHGSQKKDDALAAAAAS